MLRQLYSNLGVQHTPPPSLRLSWLMGAIDPRLSVVSGSGGTRYDSTGVLVATAAPRFDHAYNTFARKGLVWEEQRTNLFTQSGGLVTGWTQANASKVSSAGTAPDGTNSWVSLIEDNTNNQHHMQQQAITQTIGDVPAISIFARELAGSAKRYLGLFMTTVSNGNVGNASAIVDLATGAVPFNNGHYTNVIVEPAPGGAWRITAVLLQCAIAANAGFRWHICNTNGTQANQTYTGDGVSGVQLWGAQYELASIANPWPTSYTPTTTVTVTRTADTMNMLGNNFTSWCNPNKGSCVIEVDQRVVTAVGHLLSFNDGSNNNRLWVTTAATGLVQLHSTVGGSDQFVSSVAGPTASVPYRVAMAWDLANSDMAMCVNGESAVLLRQPVPPMDRVYIGSGIGVNQIDGHLRTYEHFNNVRLPNNTLRRLSTQ